MARSLPEIPKPQKASTSVEYCRTTAWYKRFPRTALLKLKGFWLDGRLDPSGEEGEPKEANATCLLVHSPTSVLMVARRLRETATGDDGEDREEQ